MVPNRTGQSWLCDISEDTIQENIDYFRKDYPYSVNIHGYPLSKYIFLDIANMTLRVYMDDIKVNEPSVAANFEDRFRRSFQLWRYVVPVSVPIKAGETNHFLVEAYIDDAREV